ncbi:hypothetical protein [Nocardia wallacei]|uniref:hypothetical protein n=1 Tax=Nocardia wallacei TaxID=480035 RepID=UPI0024584A87|nr:hypothetical protein [Nocardia wallacei]
MIALSGAVLILILAPFDFFGELLAPPSTLTIVVFVVILIAAGSARWLATAKDGTKDIVRVNRKLLEDPSDEGDRIQVALDEFDRCVNNKEEIDLFFEIFTLPSSYVRRISERVTLGDEEYATKVTRTIIGAKRDRVQSLLIPILSPPKGQLVDKLKVSSASGAVRTLSYPETVGALLRIKRTLLDMAFHTPAPANLERRLNAAILSREKASDTSKARIAADLEKALEDENKFKGGNKASWRAIFENFIADVQATFPVIVLVPAGDLVKLETEFTETRAGLERLDARITQRFWDLIHSYIRATFGLSRRSHTLQLSRAIKARSYHFRTDAPPGMYVFNIEIGLAEMREKALDQVRSGDKSRKAIIPTQDRAISPLWDAEDTRGSAYVHAYGRDLDIASAPSRLPFLAIELREKPPGLMFVVVLLSLYLAALTLGVGHWHDLIFGIANPPSRDCLERIHDQQFQKLCAEARPHPESFWPTILFGVPAIVSGWLVSRFTSESVSRLSISTIAVASWFIGNAVAAMTVAALKLTLRLSVPSKFVGIETIQPLWVILMVSTSGCAIMSVLLLWLRVRRYRRRSSGIIKRKIMEQKEKG